MPTILKIKRFRLVLKQTLNSLSNNSRLTLHCMVQPHPNQLVFLIKFLQRFVYISSYVALISLRKYFSSQSRYNCIFSLLSTLLRPNRQSTVSISPFSCTPVLYHWVIFHLRPSRSPTYQFLKHSPISLLPRIFFKPPWKFPSSLLSTFHPPPLSCLHHPLSLWLLHSHIVHD